MKFYCNEGPWGWRMWGLVGKDAKWFIGFSIVDNKEEE